MDIEIIGFKCNKSERSITDMPWYKALQERKASAPTRIDKDDKTLCNNRYSYKVAEYLPYRSVNHGPRVVA